VTVPILGSAKTAYVDGSRLLWVLPSLVHGRFGYRAIAPDRIQGDAVLLPHISHTAQSRFAFDYSSPVGGIPDHSPSPPDLWWSIGAGLWSGIPPPNSQRLLTTQTPYKDGLSEAIPITFRTVMGFAKGSTHPAYYVLSDLPPGYRCAQEPVGRIAQCIPPIRARRSYFSYCPERLFQAAQWPPSRLSTSAPRHRQSLPAAC